MALLLLGVTVAVHHPVLWIDHLLWDEVSFEKMARTGDISGKLSALIDQSIPTVFPFYALFGSLPAETLALRLASFLALWLTALAIASMLRDFAGARRETALAAGVLALTYPAYQMHANAGATVYGVSLGAFSLGIWSSLIGLRATNRREQAWLVPAAALLVVSFVMQSLFAYFYGVVAAIGLVAWRHRETVLLGLPKFARWQQARVIALLLSIPPLNYWLLHHFFPLHPYFGSTATGYNVPQFDPVPLIRGMLGSLFNTLVVPFAKLRLAPAALWIAASAVIALLFCLRRGWKPSNSRVETTVPSGRAVPLMVAGVLLLVAGLFPYVAVGKPPTIEGVQTRFAILVAPSLAVILCGLLEWLSSPKARLGAWAACIVAFTGFAWQHARAYADWQICAIKDHACVAALRRLSPPQNVGMFLIRGENLEHTYRREFYDWGRLFHEAWGGYDRIGVPEARLKPPRFHYQTPLGMSRDHVANFAVWMGYGNPALADASATVVLASSSDFNLSDDQAWSTVLRDLSCRLGIGPMSREAWLAHFITAARIETPRSFAYNSQRLPQQPLLQPDLWQWQDTVNRPSISAAGSAHPVAVHAQKDGTFSLLTAGNRGFLLRCDGMETGPGRETELALRVDAGPAPAGELAQLWGVALKLVRVPAIIPPRLVLVLADGTEIEGAWRSGDSDSLEVWSFPDSSSPPVCAWIIWRPKTPGSRLHCASVRSGWIRLD